MTKQIRRQCIPYALVVFLGPMVPAVAEATTNGMPADYVLGQPDFSSFGAMLTPSGMEKPSGVVYDGAKKRLFVSTGQNRILIYDLSAGITNGMSATFVLGQPDFTTATPNTPNGAFGCTSAVNACGLKSPAGMSYDGANQRLFVAEVGNNRVLIYDLSGSISNGMPASNVLGQPDFTTNTANKSNGTGCSTSVNACGMKLPSGLWYDAGSMRLYVADLLNSRVLVYDVSGRIRNGMPAAHVLGQADFTTNVDNAVIPASGCTTPINACGMKGPREVVLDSSSNRLFVNDSTYNYRILVFDVSAGVSNGMAATNVLGQPDLRTGNLHTLIPANGCATSVNACNMGVAQGMASSTSPDRFYLADQDDHRILIYDMTAGVSNGMPAMKVIGHSDLTTGEGYVPSPPFYGGEQYKNPAFGCTCMPNACSLANVSQIAFDPERKELFATDFNAARVLVYGVAACLPVPNGCADRDECTRDLGDTCTGCHYSCDFCKSPRCFARCIGAALTGGGGVRSGRPSTQ